MEEGEPEFTPAEDTFIRGELAGLENDPAVSETKFDADFHRRIRLEALGDLLDKAWRAGEFSKDSLLSAIMSSGKPELDAIRSRLRTVVEEGFLRPDMTVRDAESLIFRTIDKFNQDYL